MSRELGLLLLGFLAGVGLTFWFEGARFMAHVYAIRCEEDGHAWEHQDGELRCKWCPARTKLETDA